MRGQQIIKLLLRMHKMPQRTHASAHVNQVVFRAMEASVSESGSVAAVDGGNEDFKSLNCWWKICVPGFKAANINFRATVLQKESPLERIREK